MHRTDRAVLRSIAGLTSILIFEVGGSAVIKDGLGRRPLSNCRLWKGGSQADKSFLRGPDFAQDVGLITDL